MACDCVGGLHVLQALAICLAGLLTMGRLFPRDLMQNVGRRSSTLPRFNSSMLFGSDVQRSAGEDAPVSAAVHLAGTSPPSLGPPKSQPPRSALHGAAAAATGNGSPANAVAAASGNSSLAKLAAGAFLEELEPCVAELLAGADPKILGTGVPNLSAILVVHGHSLLSREAKLRSLFNAHGLKNWSFIEAYDGSAIDAKALECFFGPWVHRISGKTCCNRESSTLKPHVAFFSMVKLSLSGALILEDDLIVTPARETLDARLRKAAAMLGRCDLVRVAPFAVGYMVSNAGARKFLHYSLRRGGKRIANPMDWQMDELIRTRYDGFRVCDGPRIFKHWGHGTNQGGHQVAEGGGQPPSSQGGAGAAVVAVAQAPKRSQAPPRTPQRGPPQPGPQKGGKGPSSGFNLSSGELAKLSPGAFLQELEPCVGELLAGADPEVRHTGVRNLSATWVVHGKTLTSRAAKLRDLFKNIKLGNWSFIEAYDGSAIDSKALDCFFGQWVARISGKSCCNRESSTLKPHVAFYSAVKLNLSGVMILEDDLTFVSAAGGLTPRLRKAAAMLEGCDLVRVAPFAIGYLVSNAGARKFLHYSLRRGGPRIMNPMDWQMDALQRSRYDGFRYCEGPKIFDHWGHGTNHGGHLVNRSGKEADRGARAPTIRGGGAARPR